MRGFGGRECRFDGLAAFASVRRRTAGAGARKGEARAVNKLHDEALRPQRARVFWAAPFELVWPRPKLAGIHCFRLVGNVFPLSVDRPWAGRTRAYGPGALGTVAAELWSAVDRIAYQKLPKGAWEAR